MKKTSFLSFLHGALVISGIASKQSIEQIRQLGQYGDDIKWEINRVFNIFHIESRNNLKHQLKPILQRQFKYRYFANFKVFPEEVNYYLKEHNDKNFIIRDDLGLLRIDTISTLDIKRVGARLLNDMQNNVIQNHFHKNYRYKTYLN